MAVMLDRATAEGAAEAEACRKAGAAAVGTAAALQGRWLHERNPLLAEVVEGWSVRGPDGSVAAIEPEKGEGPGHFSVDFHGRRFRARLLGDRLAWDDGDVWVRERPPEDVEGRWRHRSDPALLETIRGGVIHGPTGTETKMIFSAEADKFSIRLRGAAYRAQLVGDLLLWSDGDVWFRARRKLGFEGHWRHKSNPSLLEVVRGSTICGPDGRQAQLFSGDGRHLRIELSGRAYSAELVDDELRWDDGDVWICTQARDGFDGHWRHQRRPELLEVISGDTVQRPDGSKAKLVVKSRSTFSMSSGGQVRSARLVDDELCWSDGDVWLRTEGSGAVAAAVAG